MGECRENLRGNRRVAAPAPCSVGRTDPMDLSNLSRPVDVLNAFPSHDYSLLGFFESRLSSAPDRPFILTDERTMSYRQFAERVALVATALAARQVDRGDRVAVMAGNSENHALLLFALGRLGAILVPINPGFNVDEARYVLQHAEVCAVACSAATLSVAIDACRDMARAPWFVTLGNERTAVVPALDDLLAGLGPSSSVGAGQPEDTCAIVYTSGTTGFPKGVMHSQRTFCLSAERQLERSWLQRDGRVLCVLPMFHINALFYSIGGALAAGVDLVIAPRFSASQFWPLAAKTGATQTSLLMAAAMILARRPREEFVGGHRLQIVIGSPVTREIADAFINDFGVEKMVEGFGMTEIPGAFGAPVDGPQTVGSMGRPGLHPDHHRQWTEARVVDDDMRDVPAATPGELLVRIPTMMQGYFKDPEQTAAAFHEGWFKTGDIVRREHDGTYTFVTRKKDIIRRRGENIAGSEIDRIVVSHPSVAEAAAVGVSADIGEEEVLVAVVLRENATLTASELRDWCSARLAAFKVPRYVVFMTKLPYTPTHKLAKHVLKQHPGLLAGAIDLHNVPQDTH